MTELPSALSSPPPPSLTHALVPFRTRATNLCLSHSSLLPFLPQITIVTVIDGLPAHYHEEIWVNRANYAAIHGYR